MLYGSAFRKPVFIHCTILIKARKLKKGQGALDQGNKDEGSSQQPHSKRQMVSLSQLLKLFLYLKAIFMIDRGTSVPLHREINRIM